MLENESHQKESYDNVGIFSNRKNRPVISACV